MAVIKEVGMKGKVHAFRNAAPAAFDMYSSTETRNSLGVSVSEEVGG